MRPASTFSTIQLSNPRANNFVYDVRIIRKNKKNVDKNGESMIPSLTVKKRKNRCSPCVYWATATFAVVADYSNLFFSFAFFLNISHFTFCYELIICSETTDVMKIIRDCFPLV